MAKRLRAKGITVALELLTHPSAHYRPKNHTDNYRGIMRKIKEEARSKCTEKDFVHLVKYEGYIQSNYSSFDSAPKKF